MSFFFEITSRETVATFGIDMRNWTANEEAYLHEVMILAMKEHPDWTKEEALAECRRQVSMILEMDDEDEEEVEFNNFEEEYGFLVDRTDIWSDMWSAYDTFKEVGHLEFMKKIRWGMEYKEFCDEFYSELRELCNICSAGMYEAFEKMKAKGWTHAEFRKDLQERKRKNREAAREKIEAARRAKEATPTKRLNV